MSARRPAPGRQISAGSLRVDAARAVMKLRDYQLPEPEMWILELLRAGVTLDAESIVVTGDSDDVRVSWEGRAPEVDDLTTLLDELVNPVADPSRRHLRLMATAVNTALGLRPRYLDIYAVNGDGVRRVRFTPSILEVDEDDPLAGASKLRNLVAEVVEAPVEAPGSGVLVHLRRYPDLGVLTTFVSGREPPELRLVRDSCDDTRVPITVGGGVMERARSDRDVLRMPLGPGVDGFMALMRAATRPDWPRPAIFEACERGVLLARHALELGFDYRHAVPIRVSVDADRLPTNASRSEVRRDDAPISTATQRVPKVFEELVKRIVRELGPSPELDWSERAREQLERSVFALLASALGTSDFRANASPLVVSALSPLFGVPLFRDAFGRPRTLSQVVARRGDGAFVYRGDEPLDESLEEWLDDLIWIRPGEPAELLFARTRIEDVAHRIEAAEESLRARRRYLRYPVHDGKVHEGEGQLLSIPLDDLAARVQRTESALSSLFFSRPALEGELCLNTVPGPAVVSYLYDGRLLAKRRIESPIAFEAVVSSPLLTPDATFSGLLDDHGAETVDQALVGAAIFAAESLARGLLGEKLGEGEPRQRWLRSQRKLAESPEVHAVLRSALSAYQRLFDRRDIEGPLWRAPAFRRVTAGGERSWVSLSKISARNEHGTHFTADLGADHRENPGLPPDRLVVCGSKAELALLRTLMPEGARFFHYERRELVTPRDPETLARELATLVGAAMKFEREDGFGAIGMTMTVPIVDIRHCGQTLVKASEADTTSPCWIVYEGRTLVPAEDRRAIVGGTEPKLFSREEKKLLRAIVEHMIGENRDDLFVVQEIFDKQVVPMLLERLGAVGLEVLLPKKSREKLRALPLFRVLGRDHAHSLDEIAALHPGTLRFVAPDHRADFDLAGFHPLRAPARLAEAVAVMLDKKARSAEKELERRRLRALRRERLERHRELPIVESPPVDDDPRSVDVDSDSAYVSKLRLSLAEVGTLEILLDDRYFARKLWVDGPPVDAIVRSRASVADETFEKVTDKALEAMRKQIVMAVPALLARIAERAPDSLRGDPAVRRLLDWWATNRPEEIEGGDEALDKLGEAKLFETVQGDRAGAAEALRRTRVYVASYVGLWIGPDEGEAPHSLDRPVIRVAEGAARDRQLALIRGITGHEIADVTKACGQLQARRRVTQGLVPKPTLHGVARVSHVHDVSALVGKDRRLRAALGPGEIGMVQWPRSRVFVHRDGRSIGGVEVDVEPPVAVTLESPDVPNDPAKLPGYAPLGERVQQLADLLVTRIVADGVQRIDPGDKRRIRAAMLSGAVLGSYEGRDELPLFETTAGLWLPKNALFEQRERFEDVWYVTDFECDDIALDPERHVFRLTFGETTDLLGDLLVMTDAAEELKLDAEARRNQQRRPVESLALEYGEERAAMAYEMLTGKGEHAIEGIVAPLRPGIDGHRGTRLSRDRHPLGEYRDLCDWPTRAVIDAPTIEPNRTWSGPKEEGEAYDEMRRAVRRASERALSGLVKIPPNALEPRRIGTSDVRRAGAKNEVRGALWARSGGDEEPVTVVDRDGVRPLRSAGEPPLPVQGRLFVNGPSSSDAAEKVARVVYVRMLISLSRQVANEWDPVKAAHLIHGLAAGLAAPDELPGDHAWPIGVGGDVDLTVVARWLSGEMGIVWYVPPEQVDSVRETFSKGSGGPTEDNPWLIDDRSMAARALLMHLDWRAKAWPPEASATPSFASQEITVDDDDELSTLPVEFDEVVEQALAPSLPLAIQPPTPTVADRIHEALGRTSISAHVDIVPSRRRAILRRTERGYELTERHATVVAVQNALDQGDPRATAALAILTARVVGEANRARDDVTAEHEIEALVTLLGTR